MRDSVQGIDTRAELKPANHGAAAEDPSATHTEHRPHIQQVSITREAFIKQIEDEGAQAFNSHNKKPEQRSSEISSDSKSLPSPPKDGHSSLYILGGGLVCGAALFYGAPFLATHVLGMGAAKVLGVKALLSSTAHSSLSSGVMKAGTHVITSGKIDKDELADKFMEGSVMGAGMGVTHLAAPLILPLHNAGILSTSASSAVVNGAKEALKEGSKAYKKGGDALEVVKNSAQGAVKGVVIGASIGAVAAPMVNHSDNITQNVSRLKEWAADVSAGAVSGGLGGAVGGAVTESASRIVSNVKNGENIFKGIRDSVRKGAKEGGETGLVVGAGIGGAVYSETDSLRHTIHDNLNNLEVHSTRNNNFTFDAKMTTSNETVHRDLWSGKTDIDVDIHLDAHVCYDDNHHIKTETVPLEGEAHVKMTLDEHNISQSKVKIDGNISGTGRVDLRHGNGFGHIRHHEDFNKISLDIDGEGTIDKFEITNKLVGTSEHVEINTTTKATISNLRDYELNTEGRVDVHWVVKHHEDIKEHKEGVFSR